MELDRLNQSATDSSVEHAPINIIDNNQLSRNNEIKEPKTTIEDVDKENDEKEEEQVNQIELEELPKEAVIEEEAVRELFEYHSRLETAKGNFSSVYPASERLGVRYKFKDYFKSYKVGDKLKEAFEKPQPQKVPGQSFQLESIHQSSIEAPLARFLKHERLDYHQRLLTGTTESDEKDQESAYLKEWDEEEDQEKQVERHLLSPYEYIWNKNCGIFQDQLKRDIDGEFVKQQGEYHIEYSLVQYDGNQLRQELTAQEIKAKEELNPDYFKFKTVAIAQVFNNQTKNSEIRFYDVQPTEDALTGNLRSHKLKEIHRQKTIDKDIRHELDQQRVILPSFKVLNRFVYFFIVKHGNIKDLYSRDKTFDQQTTLVLMEFDMLEKANPDYLPGHSCNPKPVQFFPFKFTIRREERVRDVRFFSTNDSTEQIDETMVLIITNKKWYLEQLYTDLSAKLGKKGVNQALVQLSFPTPTTKDGIRGKVDKKSEYHCYKIHSQSIEWHQLVSELEEKGEEVNEFKKNHDVFLLANKDSIIQVFIKKQKDKLWKQLSGFALNPKKKGLQESTKPHQLNLNEEQLAVVHEFYKSIHQTDSNLFDYDQKVAGSMSKADFDQQYGLDQDEGEKNDEETNKQELLRKVFTEQAKVKIDQLNSRVLAFSNNRDKFMSGLIEKFSKQDDIPLSVPIIRNLTKSEFTILISPKKVHLDPLEKAGKAKDQTVTPRLPGGGGRESQREEQKLEVTQPLIYTVQFESQNSDQLFQVPDCMERDNTFSRPMEKADTLADQKLVYLSRHRSDFIINSDMEEMILPQAAYEKNSLLGRALAKVMKPREVNQFLSYNPQVVYAESPSRTDKMKELFKKINIESKVKSLVINQENESLHFLEKDKEPSEIQDFTFSSEDGGDGLQRNRVITERFTFIEDNDGLGEVPTVLYRQDKPENFQLVCFAILNNAGLVKNTFVNIPFQPFKGSLQLSKSSDLLIGERTLPNGERKYYLSQKFVICKHNLETNFTELYEISLKVIKVEGLFFGFDDSKEYHAQLSGYKIILSGLDTSRRAFVMPMFAVAKKDKQNFYSSHICGVQLRVLDSDDKLIQHFGFETPNFTEVKFKMESEFAYNRVSFCNDNRILVAESWIKPELVQMGDIEQLQMFDERHDSFFFMVLQRGVKQALNQQQFDNFVDYLSMPQDRDPSFFYRLKKVFAPTDIFKGFSIAEVHQDSDFIIKAYKDLKIVKDSRPKTFIGSVSRMPKFIRNPLETLLAGCPEEQLAKRIIKSKLFVTYKDAMRRNINLVSPLQQAFDNCLKKSPKDYPDFEYFENLLKIVDESRMMDESKRFHFMSVINRSTVVFQNEFRDDSKIFKPILKFIQEPTNELLEDSEGEEMEVETVSIRRIIDSTSLKTDITEPHISEVACRADITVQAGSYITDLQKPLEKMINDEQCLQIQSKQRRCCKKCFPGEGYFVEYSYFEFTDLILAEKISEILKAKDLDSFQLAREYKFNEIKLQELTSGLLKMTKFAKTELGEMLTLKDLIDYQFIEDTQYNQQLEFIWFIFFIVLPFVAQLSIENSVATDNENSLASVNDGLDTVKKNIEGNAILAINVIPTVCQIISLIKELLSIKEYKPVYSDYLQIYNIIDLVTMSYAISYGIIRMIFPYGANLTYKNYIAAQAGNETQLYDAMPMLHVVMCLVIVIQGLKLLTQFDNLSKFVKLVKRGCIDVKEMLVIFFTFLLLFLTMFLVLGARFDDGDPFDSDPDAYKGPYRLLSNWFIQVVCQSRGILGDIMEPNYNYWVDRYQKGDEHSQNAAKFYSAMIYIVFVAQNFLFIIFLLNYVIAVVSDTYSNIIENERMSIIESREELNSQNVKENPKNQDKQIEVLVMASVSDGSGDAEWEGISKSIKKKISSLDKSLVKRIDTLRKSFKAENRNIIRNFKQNERQLQFISDNLRLLLEKQGLAGEISQVQEEAK